MSMLLSESRVDEMNERIESVVEAGDVSAIVLEDDAVIEECARRYIEGQVKLRERAAARSVETTEKFDKAAEGLRSRYRTKANLITTQLEDDFRREWTAELLAGEFALPNGARVTWATATAAQHGLRADQLEGLAAGNMVTAAIHRQAINDLRVAGVDRLGDLS